jgi:hypothetical protein
MAGFDGTLEVVGFGVGNTQEAVDHRRYAGRADRNITVANLFYDDDLIRVFMDSAPCSTFRNSGAGALSSFAHELGHFTHDRDHTLDTERTADMYARRILKKYATRYKDSGLSG